ncbi:ATP-binding protein [Mycobacterium servetii]|uniref:ATP-binding protein n=1 Tax=Mycobacterium servetii TaxID=3237418 RepID=A0ABV4C9F5_9MYCO
MTSRVDPQGARRMMEMLVNLYADRRLAVVREYVANAVDATRAAGSDEPVAVTTPSLVEPNFVVSDRGTGMSCAEVEATFLAFAASSKRDSNELVGGLGVGAKSAWTLAESFLVDTVKGGCRTTVRAARNLEHQVLLADAPTDLADGTTIIVPVEVAGHVEAWHRVVREVAAAHDAGAVLVDGEPVDSLAGGPNWVGPVCFRRVERPDRGVVVVRSGGTLFSSVPEVTSRVIDGIGRVSGCVIELPIGSFDHTPSRESVIATERTLAAVDAALGRYRIAYEALAQRITELADRDVAGAVALRADTLAGVGEASMLPIPLRVRVPGGTEEWVVRHGRGGRARWERVTDVRDDLFDAVSVPAEMSRTLVVSGVPAGRVLSRFATFVAQEHPTVARVVALPEGRSALALDVVRPGDQASGQTWQISMGSEGLGGRYSYEQWRAALAAGRSVRGPVTGYDCDVCHRDGAGRCSATLSGPQIAALGLPVIYVEDKRPYRSSSGQLAIASVTVYLGKRKSGPLLAAVPQAMTSSAWLQRRFATETAGWSQTELLAAAYTCASESICKAAFEIAASAAALSAPGHPHRALLTRIGALVRSAETVTEAQSATMRALSGCPTAQEQFAEIRTMSGELRQAYPLLAHVRRWDNAAIREHYVAYVAHTPPQTARTAA